MTRLSRSHPALGAFKPQPPINWECIADELAYGLRSQMRHDDDGCPCAHHFSLRVYEAAKELRRSRT